MIENWPSTIVYKMEDNDLVPQILVRRDAITQEKTEAAEAGPSITMEEAVASKSRLGSALQKHSIFLSHSGFQKPFVRRLRDALVRNAYHPFFDEDPDCLAKGELFAQRIRDECRLTDVAVVVLSDEFFTSKWPMIELAIFVEEQRRRKSVPDCKDLKILPLFMSLSVGEFRNEERRKCWLDKWNELGAADSRINVSGWEKALKVVGDTNGEERCRYRTEEDYIESIVSRLFALVAPDLRCEDTYVKGKSKFHQITAEMFARAPSRTRFHKVRAIGVYGMGGMGKTTLCKFLCDAYFVQFNGKVWHAELGKKSAEDVQKDVLRHLVGTSETLLNHERGKCKDQFQTLMQKEIRHKVFLAIDNIWNEGESREQVEALLEMGFHSDSLVILTSRSCEVLEWLGIHRECCYEMPELEKYDATAVLLQSAAPGCGYESLTDNQRIVVDKVVERCFMTKGPISSTGSEKQYVPLALKVMGRQLRLPLLRDTPTQLENWVYKLDLKCSDQRQHPVFSVLRLSYDNLHSHKHRRIFLDVALSVPRQHDNTSASVMKVCKWLSMVYCETFNAILGVLEDLQRDGLVERWQDMASPFGMHELYYEFAKVEAAKADDVEKQHHLYHEDDYGEYLPDITQWIQHQNYLSLRRVHIYGGGFTQLSSDSKLECLVNVEVLKLDFCFELESLSLSCLKRLRSLELTGCLALQEVQGLDRLQHLKFFRWNTCRMDYSLAGWPRALEVVEIYGSKDSTASWMVAYERCVDLLELTMSNHPILTSSINLWNFQRLEKMDISGCDTLHELRGLGSLRCLKFLDLKNCQSLCHCDGLEKLVEIQTLNLGGCENLRLLLLDDSASTSYPMSGCMESGMSSKRSREVWDFASTSYPMSGCMESCMSSKRSREVWDLSTLVNLRSINISGNLLVQRLVLGSRRLEQVEVVGCKDLRTVALPSHSDSWKVLSWLNERWRGEPVESRRWTVDLRSVIDPNSFDAYETLNLSNCHTLESLGDIGFLTSLRYLYVQNCRMLRTLPNLSGSSHLQLVDLSYCCILEDLGDIGPLRTLQCLYLGNCGMLRSLPALCSPCLQVLDLSRCSQLEDLSNIGPLRGLQNLYLRNCGMLRSLPALCSPCLQELDLSGCSKLEDLGDIGPLRTLQYLYLRDCWSLRSLRELCSPCLKELDLSGCSKLEDLGRLYSLSSLQMLNLNECVLLGTLPSWNHGHVLEVLNVKGYINLRDRSQLRDLNFRMAMPNVVMDGSDCWSLGKTSRVSYLIMLEVDAFIGDPNDPDVAADLEFLRLNQTCLEDSSAYQRPETVELSKHSSKEPLQEEFIINSVAKGVRHFKNIRHFLCSQGSPLTPRFSAEEEPKLDSLGQRPLFPRQTYYTIKFTSMSMTFLNDYFLNLCTFSFLSRLEIIRCRNIRYFYETHMLHALETLVISRCDELETLPDLTSVTALKHLTIQGFRQGRKFQFMFHLSQPVHAYPVKWRSSFNVENLVTLNLEGCVGLGGLEHWGPLPALESLVIKDCNTITQLPDLSMSSKLSSVIVMNCGRLRRVDVGPEEALRVVRIEDCGHEVLLNTTSRGQLRLELKKILDSKVVNDYFEYYMPNWLRSGGSDGCGVSDLDMFEPWDWGRVLELEEFNLRMEKWAMGQVTILETNPVTSLEINPVTSLETNPVTSLELNPVTSLETNPVTSLETNPVASLERNPVTNPEVQDTENEASGASQCGKKGKGLVRSLISRAFSCRPKAKAQDP